MKRLVSVAVGVAVLGLFAGAALAFRGPGGHGMGPGMMGGGPTMGGRMGAGPGGAGCPGMAGTTAAAPVTEEKARELAQAYADQYLKGFAVDKVLPFTTRRGTGYSVELKGPNDELRTLHVNPWGNVMPFGGPWRRPA